MRQGAVRSGQPVEDKSADFARFETSERYTEREKIALRYASAIMWNPADAEDAMWTDLHREFTEPELVEMGYWVGFTFGGQRWLHTLNTRQGELDAFLSERGAAGAEKTG